MVGVLAARRLELYVAVVVVILDQITKAMVRPVLSLHESMVVIPGFVDFTRVHNTGAAFGMMNSVDFPFKTLVLSLVALIALGGVAWYAVTYRSVIAWPGSASPACWAARSAT